jgi:hypothetical protein
MSNKNSIIIPGLEDLPEFVEHLERKTPPMGPKHSLKKPQHHPVDFQVQSPKLLKVPLDDCIE